MPTALQFRRGTTAQHSTFTGAIGELTVDTEKNTVVVHDGSTAGGHSLVVGGTTVSLPNLTVTGNLTVQGTTVTIDSATAQTVDLGDDDKIRLGTGNDLEIYHDGSNSFIDDAGTGALNIRSNTVAIDKYTGEAMARFYQDAGVYLYYNGAAKFETTAAGVNVTGTALTDGVTVDGTLKINEVIEKAEPSNSTSGTIGFYFLDQAVINFKQNQTANRTINFTGDGSTTLDSMLSDNESVTCSILMPQGSTPYYLNAYEIDGSAVTPKWSGGSAPTGGNASGTDVYSFTIIKTASATFTVLASQTQYA
tara:strand:- start:13643 stop:14563 length:921 start_codon:yes stop_codon:yes gene_type:complete